MRHLTAPFSGSYTAEFGEAFLPCMDFGSKEGNLQMPNRTSNVEAAASHPGVDELRRLFKENRAGKRRGIYAVCSANRLVLEAAFARAKQDRSPLLIEATSNQVNQEGGYTGQTPAQFRDYVHSIAKDLGFPTERLILGGDHLGPNPWRAEPAEAAMEKACAMVSAYAAAGFSKIHLDASMACADDPGGAGGPVDEETATAQANRSMLSEPRCRLPAGRRRRWKSK